MGAESPAVPLDARAGQPRASGDHHEGLHGGARPREAERGDVPHGGVCDRTPAGGGGRKAPGQLRRTEGPADWRTEKTHPNDVAGKSLVVTSGPARVLLGYDALRAVHGLEGLPRIGPRDLQSDTIIPKRRTLRVMRRAAFSAAANIA